MATLLTEDDVRTVLTMADTVEVVEEAFRQYALGSVQVPLRIGVKIPAHNGFHGVMQAYVGGDSGSLAVKTGSMYRENPAKNNLPGIILYVLLYDPTNGTLLALMGGNHLTAMRTAAVCGVATKYLARQDAEVLGLFGAGVEGRTQILAIHEVRPLKKVKVFDPVPGKAPALAQEMAATTGIEISAVDDPREAVVNCDIVSATTSSATPVFEGNWLEDGTHVNAIGSHAPAVQELDSDTVARAKVVVDSKEAVLAEAGDFIVPIKEGRFSEDHIYAELGELITGAKQGRSSKSEITLFKSVGLALQDAAAAARTYRLAKEKGVGTEVAF
jgi:ornithine cyclodeaminase/alanine dehydrogenase